MSNPIPGDDAERDLFNAACDSLGVPDNSVVARKLWDKARAAPVSADVAADIWTWEQRVAAAPKDYAERTAMLDEIAELRARLAAGAPAETVKAVMSWEARIYAAHPRSESEHWPVELKAKYMNEEIGDLRKVCTAKVKAIRLVPAGRLDDAEIDAIAHQHDLYSIQDNGKVSGDDLRSFARNVICAGVAVATRPEVTATPSPSAEVARDAARLDFLDSRHVVSLSQYEPHNGSPFIEIEMDALPVARGMTVREAIDAAMKLQAPAKEQP